MKRLVIAVLVIFASACAASQPTKIEKNQAEFYFNQGVAWNEKGDYDKAISEYTKAIEINPSLAEAYNNRGLAYAQGKGQYDKAISDCTKAIEINPSLAEAYNNRGLAYAQGKGQYDKAISDCTKAIEINPSLEEAYSNRGLAYLLLGQSQPGCHDLQKACELGSCIGLTWAKERGHCR